MKHASFSNVRDPDNRSKKWCVCGGHSHKARKKRRPWRDRMPTRKIAEAPSYRFCRHPDHEPPQYRLFEPGTYEHTCPGCRSTRVFTVHTRGHMSEIAQAIHERRW